MQDNINKEEKHDNREIISVFTIIVIKNMSLTSRILKDNKISPEELDSMFKNLPDVIKKLIKEINVKSCIQQLKQDEIIRFLDVSYNKILCGQLDPFRLLRTFLIEFRWSQLKNSIYMEGLLELIQINISNLKESLLFIHKEYNLKELLLLFYSIGNINTINIISFKDGEFGYEHLIKDVEQDIKNHFNVSENVADRIIKVDSCELSFDSLFKYAESINRDVENSCTVVIGMERLLMFKDKSDFTIKFLEGDINLHYPDNMDWEKFTHNLDMFFTKFNNVSNYITGVFIQDNINKVPVEKVTLLAEKLCSFDIMHLTSYNSEEEVILNHLLYKLGQMSTKEYIDSINENENNISCEQKSMLYAYLLLHNNDYLRAIKVIEELYKNKNLSMEYLDLLGQLYLKVNKTNKSLQVYEEIYNKDNLNINAINNILTLLNKDNSKNNEIYKYIKKALKINSQDVRILEHLANYHAENKTYNKSSAVWKYIFKLTDDRSYHFLGEFNSFLLDFYDKSIDEIIDWSTESLCKYPEYKNDIFYRVGELIYYGKESKYRERALAYFNKVDIIIDDKISYNTSINKMEIYYWRYFREKYKYICDRNANEFLSNLIENIPILTYGSKSTYKWSKYLYGTLSLPYNVWLEYLHEKLFDYLHEWQNIIMSESNATTALDIEDIDICNNFIETEYGMMPDLSLMSMDQYLVFLLANGQAEVSKGNIQIANDIAYEFFNLSNKLEGKYKKVALSFGLLTWSNNSFVINSSVEGVLSFISAIEIGIEINEYGLGMTMFMGNILEYIYNLADTLELSDAKKKLLKKYFELTNSPESLYHSIVGDYDKVLRSQSEEIRGFAKFSEKKNIKFIINFRVDSKDQLLYIDNIIHAFYKKSMISESIKYINTFKETLLLNSYDNFDIASNYFIKWSDILCEFGKDELALDLLRHASNNLIKLRAVSHKEERSFFGDRLKKVNEKMLYIMSNYKKDFTNDDEFISCIVNLLPKSIIEQRYQNFNMIISDDLKYYEEKYYHLDNIIKSTNYKEPNNPIYEENIKEFLDTKEYLEKNHPKFKSLPLYELQSGEFFKEIQERLLSNDIFYQNMLIDKMLIHICVTKESKSIKVEKIDLEKLNSLLDKLSIEIDRDILNIENSKFEEYIDMFNQISHMLFTPLLKSIDKKTTLYYMPDLSLKNITPNYLRVESGWMIETINKIELVIDYYDIKLNKKDGKNLSNKYFSSNSKKGCLDIIKNNLETRNYFENILMKDNTLIIKEPLDTLVIVAHGVSYLFEHEYQGALNLELSREKQISLKESLVIEKNIENIIVIACSSGSPIDSKIERDNGVWSSLFEKNVNNILLCKWDVSTEYTNNILKILLDKMNEDKISLSQALRDAQLEYINKNPILWAGLEVWKNQ